ncbi:MAG: gwa2 protein [Candidatus Parcubacteria bacterium]|jgi:hypothetical protein
MEQHPIPRQITTFEFKLIGFMTLHQFLYLLAFIPPAFIVYKLFPIPILNVILALLIFGIGAVMAFIPYQDRPLDQWIKNLWKRLNSPTQYTYHKHNPPFYLIQNLYFVTDPHKVLAHIESREKLAAYLATTQKQEAVDHRKKTMQSLLRKPSSQLATAVQPKMAHPVVQVAAQAAAARQTTPAAPPVTRAPYVPQMAGTSVMPPPQPAAPPPNTPTIPPPVMTSTKHPFIIGTIKNNKKIPVPGILVYIKDSKGSSLRLLKTNPHGMFASFNPLATGDYTLEVKDPNGSYFFDTMNVHIDQGKPAVFDVYSKEML